MPKKAKRKPGVFNAPKTSGPTVETRTPNVPDYRGRVDAVKYEAMKKLLLKVMPKKAPGFTQAEMFAALGKKAPQAIFPARTYMWWGKCVQLDLEARGYLVREDAKPLRWHQK